MKIKEAIQNIKSSLKNIYDEREAGNIAIRLIEHFLNIPKVKIISSYDDNIAGNLEIKISDALKELETYKPIQYVVGYTMFLENKIKVNENVLIPRPETEELVQLIIQDHKRIKQKIKILDIGTGCGCIAIALKKGLPDSVVHAADISEAALSAGRENAKDNDAEIVFHHFDILNNATWPSMQEFDLIVSNPPYVRESEKVLMKKNVLNFEPPLSLFVPDDDPLKLYNAIAVYSENFLKNDGTIYFEINEALAAETAEIFEKRKYSCICIKTDLKGKQRFLTCKKP
jgi:release factor glutamine methyltransferase